MIAEPPVEVGATQPTIASALPATAVTDVGAAGTLADGVTAFDAAEFGPAPTLLIAATRNRYAVPFVKPVMTRLVAAEPVLATATVHDAPAFDDCSIR